MTSLRRGLALASSLLACACGGGGGSGELPEPDIGDWTTMAPMPQERSEISAATWDGKIYIAGGLVSGGIATELLIYDASANTWSTGAAMPAGRHHGALIAHDGKLYFLGGYEGSSRDVETWVERTEVYVYDIAMNAWADGTPLPTAMAAHAAVLDANAADVDARIHLIGGTLGGVATTRHLVYDIGLDDWSTGPSMPTARHHLGAAFLGDRIYVAGGRATGSTNLATFEAFDLTGNNWVTLPPVPTARSGLAVVEFEGRIYVFGGERLNDPTTFRAAERYDPIAGDWEAVTHMPTARHGLAAATLGIDHIYVISGGRGAGFSYSDLNERWTTPNAGL